jgi:LmbE family N-acetylglucosaminyl deacetylase
MNTNGKTMNPYHKLVQDYSRLLVDGKSFPLGNFPPAARPAIEPGAPTALFIAPHPDDECIVGAIAFRLMRQARMKVVNVAITLGRINERKAERLRELHNACNYVGFELVLSAPEGLDHINPTARQEDPSHWAACVGVVRKVIEQRRPKVIIFPHERDWNSTHIGTHYLIMDALKEMPADFECYLIETEIWGAMDDPNVLLEVGPDDLGDMMTATTFHIGEVRRNPYHLLLPAWMMDNVRRGSEVSGGQGTAAAPFTFAALYRLRKWSDGQARRFFDGGKQVPVTLDIGSLLR